MAIMMTSTFAFEIVNSVLLVVLMSIYARSLTKIKSNFTIGLMIFAGFLLLQNILGIYLGLTSMEQMTSPFERYAFFINITEMIALLALFWISWK